MKKLLVYLGVIILLFGALYIVNQQSDKASEDDSNLYKKKESSLHPETRKLLDDPNYQNIILPNELESALDNKEDLFVYYFQSTCVHCAATTPVLMPMAEEASVDLKQFNLLEFEEGWSDYNIEATPTLVYYKNGKEVDRMVGGVAHDGQSGYAPEDFEQFLAKYKGE